MKPFYVLVICLFSFALVMAQLDDVNHRFRPTRPRPLTVKPQDHSNETSSNSSFPQQQLNNGADNHPDSNNALHSSNHLTMDNNSSSLTQNPPVPVTFHEPSFRMNMDARGHGKRKRNLDGQYNNNNQYNGHNGVDLSQSIGRGQQNGPKWDVWFFHKADKMC